MTTLFFSVFALALGYLLGTTFSSRTKSEHSENYLNSLQSKLTESEARYELVTTNIAASVLIRDEGGEIVFCSPYTEVLTGYTVEEVLGLPDLFEEIVVENDKARYLRARTISELGEDSLVRYQVRHKSGIRMWLESRFVPVCDEEGNVNTIMGVTIDVTSSVNYQHQIEEQNRDLGDFAYMVSHDLKAPIFTIKGMTAALLEDCSTALSGDAKELLRYTIDAADRLEKLVASILEYSGVSLKQETYVDIDLLSVINSAIQDQRTAIELCGATITVEQDLPAVRGEQVRIYQVFSNIIGNALKYRSAQRPLEIQIKVRGTVGDLVIIDIHDNGLGIPKDKISDVFRPYHRAHGYDIEGSGIGLACVKKIVERLGGSTSVTSEVEKGSTFTISLPTATKQPRAIPQDLARCFTQ